MTIPELILLFRKQVQDLNKPYLWDDVEVLQYLIAAQDKFVTKTGGIRDSSTRALTDVSVVVGEVFAPHSPYILRVRSAKLLTAQRSLDVVNEADIGRYVVSDYGLITPEYLDDEDTGDVKAIVLGVEDNKIRWLKVPVTADTCRMNIMRLPYPRIKDLNGCLEIQEQFHMDLLLWMKHLAYAKQDAEVFDKRASEDYERQFYDRCDEAKTIMEGQRFKPRVVQYGGL